MKIWRIPRIAIAIFVVGAAIFTLSQGGRMSGVPDVNRLVDGLCSATSFALATEELPPPIRMKDHSEWLGRETKSKTFSIAIADLNKDSRDDILIGAHDENPYLYINEASSFSNQSSLLFPEPFRRDRHGYTFADLDNDNDLDVAISGGGNDGVGKGSDNIFLQNTSEGGSLSFVRMEAPENIALAPSRSRSLIPVASREGSLVDLYLTTLKRNGYPNRLFRNTGDDSIFGFSSDDDDPLTLSLDDHGRGFFADFDSDGVADYLAVTGSNAVLYWGDKPNSPPQKLSNLAYSVSAADFNNDGKLDIYVGRFAPPTLSDRVSHDSGELIYVIHKHREKDSDALSFTITGTELEFDLRQHIKANEVGRFNGAKDIFMGSGRLNPDSRHFIATMEQASGAPSSLDKPGIYIWYDNESGRWEIRWQFPVFLNLYKGVITSQGISQVKSNGLDTREPRWINDYLLVNDGDGNFSRLCNIESEHNEKTVAVTAADFNNDGWLDIIGARHGEQGAVNGEVFVLNNYKGKFFSSSKFPVRQQDRLHRADLVAHGFFNGDDKPDIIVTNGYGQIPGTKGPTQLMFNETETSYSAALIRIQGTTANAFGVGAKLTLKDSRGVILGYRVQGMNSNISQDTFWQHFGLGEIEGPYTLTVDWPDDTTSSHIIDSAGRHLIQQ